MRNLICGNTLVLVACLLPLASTADIYQGTEATGSLKLSDQPFPGAILVMQVRTNAPEIDHGAPGNGLTSYPLYQANSVAATLITMQKMGKGFMHDD